MNKYATLRNLFTQDEYIQYKLHLYLQRAEIPLNQWCLTELLNLGKSILPLLYPDYITDGSSIIAKTFDFITQKAQEKGLTIF